MTAVPQLGSFELPTINNEPMRHYEPRSADRAALQAAVDEMRRQAPFEVPCVVDGRHVKTGRVAKQLNPSEHARALCHYHEADEGLVEQAIRGSLRAKAEWASMPWNERATVFLKAADLVSGKYRFRLMAATMLGQGKNAWQAEIDAAAELADFFRFGVKYMHELYSQQPPRHAPGTWNRLEYRALEGFVLAVSPFNFTAIGGNLPGAPAMVGNVVVWKPSPMAVYSNYLVHQILTEAGLPAGVIQFVPGPAEPIVAACLNHRDFASLHFTGSTLVFRQLWKQIANNLDVYRGYPRIVGETGGKNFHLVHKSADVDQAVFQAIRGAFEYQGQKCSALSRLYVPKSMWQSSFKPKLLQRVSEMTQGPVHELRHFVGPVIARHSYDKILSLVEAARREGGEVLCGGEGDDAVGYYVRPTVIETREPRSVTMRTEIFGPVLTVYAYDDEGEDGGLDDVCALIDSTTDYSLTGAVFASERRALVRASNLLRDASGMFYVNDKCTGAVVGQQCFGGARASGTNDKAGSAMVLQRFVSVRTIKETMVEVDGFGYPSNLEA